MKIDTSNINLSSTWAFFKKDQVQVEKEVRFSDEFDQKMESLMVSLEDEQFASGITSQWYDFRSVNGQDAVELSGQFLEELGKLKQILEAISQRINTIGLRGCCIQITAIDRININAGWQSSVKMLEYEYSEKRTISHYEKENTSFFADGVVKTTDGKSIDFSFQMNLEREFFREDQFIHQEKGYVLIDPLVINLDGTMPQLSGALISFDLDMDGEAEDIYSLMPGTGFLSYDKNKDGIINDGSELFGPTTGDGFKELSQYDLDHNSWIDENDAIFDELTIWESNEAGEMQLTKLKDAGIGAIYLVTAQTPFDLRNNDNELQARIQRTGIALNEDGSVSAIQEMDWTA